MTAQGFLDHVLRTCWQGSLVLMLIWAVGRLLPRLPASTRAWLWRIAYLKLVISLLIWQTVELPVLAPEPSEQFFPSTEADSRPTSRSWWLLALWLSWVAGYAAHAIAVTRRMHKLLASVRDVETPELAGLCATLGVKRIPRIQASPDVPSALLVAGLSPVIVLPEDTSPSDRPLILAHELAHIRRADVLWNWLPFAAHAAYGLCPVLWLAARSYHFARECACDELALRATGATPRAYGTMLFNASLTKHALEPAAMGVASRYGFLRTRISALASHQRVPANHRLLLGLIGLTVAAFTPSWQLTAATPPESPLVSISETAADDPPVTVSEAARSPQGVISAGASLRRRGVQHRVVRSENLAVKREQGSVRESVSRLDQRRSKSPVKQPMEDVQSVDPAVEKVPPVQETRSEAKLATRPPGHADEFTTVVEQPSGNRTAIVSGRADTAETTNKEAPPKVTEQPEARRALTATRA